MRKGPSSRAVLKTGGPPLSASSGMRSRIHPGGPPLQPQSAQRNMRSDGFVEVQSSKPAPSAPRVMDFSYKEVLTSLHDCLKHNFEGEMNMPQLVDLVIGASQRNKIADVKDFLRECMIGCFEKQRSEAKKRSLLADFLVELGRKGFMKEEDFVEAVLLYTRRLEDYIVDSPKMCVHTIELINCILMDKTLVMDALSEMRKVTLNPKDPECVDRNLKNQVGKALCIFMTEDDQDSETFYEKEELIELLRKDGIQKFFDFKDEKDAHRFLRTESWFQLAGY